MKKILLILLCLTLAASCFMMTACGDTPTECTEHTDADSNRKCDNCGADVQTQTPGGDETPGGNDQTGADEPKEEGGCKSALTIGALATMILAGAWITIAARKKEN